MGRYLGIIANVPEIPSELKFLVAVSGWGCDLSKSVSEVPSVLKFLAAVYG